MIPKGFYQSVTMLSEDRSRLPKTPAEYAALDEKERRHYSPEYEHHRDRRVRRYEECDLGHTHYMGWEAIQVPVGEPYRYVPVSLLVAEAMDAVLNSNVLASRILYDQN